MIELGLNPENYTVEYPIAVAAVQSLTKNVVWNDMGGGGRFWNDGTLAGAELCWIGSTKNLGLPRPSTIDVIVYGNNPYGLAAACSLQLLWNGNALNRGFVWNTTDTQQGMLSDQFCMSQIVSGWSGLST